ncbi:aminoacyl-histidine dipeptidase [uncultured Fusobacterium sp.]|uniref:aminoacyl-histidine dipeptidase n=1 Tax=uncultured Fusobacterium sp. TaxID=159267 RepID=UPI0028046A86|nr:aminoacyl-histidine dipeptidase [uncultured Fusobacterium sp.]
MMRKLVGIKPERVFYHFEEISKIPRESYNEKAISDYLVEFGKKLNLETYQDKYYNVILRKKASQGYEDAPGIIIQGHMDMVCEKENDSNHDFKKDPIDLVVDGNRLKANKTTLGGDNGIAIAMGMAILEDESIKCGTIELLATTSEEIDLNGALSLEPNILKGKMLINIDSEDEGVITVGSAGGVEIDILLPIERETLSDVNLYTLSLEKLQGGHSGVEINQKRGNSNKILVEVLQNLKALTDYSLVEVFGGSKDNAIPRSGKVVLASSKDIKDIISKVADEVKAKYISFEPEMIFTLETTTSKEISVLSNKSLDNYIKTIEELPTGVNTWMKEYPEIVESSDNLAIVKTLDENINIIISLRSSDPEVLKELKEKISNILKENNALFEFSAGYPEWKFRAESKLRDKALEVYKKLYNKDMKVEVIHAGLECGAISQNYPDIDFISVGPNLRDVHTPSEYLEIDSTERVYNYVVELINSLN